jgi:hypothetical protein
MLLTADIVSTPLVLAAIYSCLVVYVALTLAALKHGSPMASLRSLFTVSCLAAAALRVISFASLGAINYYARTDDDRISRDSPGYSFLEKSLLVLFDLPDFCCVSAYLLLLLKWTDVFLHSRKHWLNSLAYKRLFVGVYLVLNTLLYAAQIALYSLLFVPSVNQEVLAAAIYYTLAAINLAVPALWVITFLVLSLQVNRIT